MTAFSEQSLAHDLLGADGERSLAAQIERHELELWQRLLTYAPLRAQLLELVETSVKQPPDELDCVRRAQTTSALADAVAPLAHQLRVCDPERQAMRAALRLVAEHSRETPAARKFAATVEADAERLQRAQTRFVQSNLRLVFSLARRYSQPPMPLDDLIQEGNIGLMRAVNRYEYRRGYRFSTYATWWIYHGIRRALANASSTVRIPVHAQELFQRIGVARATLGQRLGREPSTDELADHLATSKATIERVSAQAMVSMVSLDQPIDDHHGSQLMPQLAASAQQTAFDTTARAELSERFATLLANISPVQADVLRKRFGLHGEREHSLQEIGNEYGLSRERIRQIEKAALARLRRLPQVAALRA